MLCDNRCAQQKIFRVSHFREYVLRGLDTDPLFQISDLVLAQDFGTFLDLEFGPPEPYGNLLALIKAISLPSQVCRLAY